MVSKNPFVAVPSLNDQSLVQVAKARDPCKCTLTEAGLNLPYWTWQVDIQEGVFGHRLRTANQYNANTSHIQMG